MTQASAARVEKTDWWRGGIIYQIYPRSFQDSNGDGVGDLPGITRRLGHIADLGCDAVWLSPFFTSPMLDMGYDVSDYTGVDPVFGTLADFDALLITFAERLSATVIVRGLRGAGDFEYEFQMTGMNRALNDDLEQVFLMADVALQPIASRLVQEIAVYGGDIRKFVPPRIAADVVARVAETGLKGQ